ncbi:MAG: flagellar hook-length control protein FliK [Arcobacteraceae bacterium]|nr:flagellar hook-length control protein FliK [Arcobacteraceae bacterium]
MEIIQNLKQLQQTEILKTLGKLGSTHTNLQDLTLQKELLLEKNISQNKTLTDGLKTILQELFQNTKSDKILLDMMKNSAIFKTFEQLGSETKKLVELVEQKNSQNQNLTALKSFFVNVDGLDEKTIKQTIEKTILTSQTKDILGSFLQSDDKEIQNQANKILQHIEYFQLVSYLNNSLYTYLPFDWDSFDGGDIEFKKEKEKQYTCHINLELKEYGKVKINLLYDEGNHISIGFFLENDELKEKMSNNLQDLRKSLKTVGVNVQNISLIDAKENSNDERLNRFEEMNSTQKIGLDLTV